MEAKPHELQFKLKTEWSNLADIIIRFVRDKYNYIFTTITV